MNFFIFVISFAFSLAIALKSQKIGGGTYRVGVGMNRGASSIDNCFSPNWQFVGAKWKLTDALLNKPKPTHKWWSSAAWQRCLDDSNAAGSYLLFAYPLAYRARPQSLQVSYPTEYAFFDSTAFPFLRAYKLTFDPFDFQIVFPVSPSCSVAVEDYSDIHLSLLWKDNERNAVRVVLGRGLLFTRVETVSLSRPFHFSFQGRIKIWLQTNSIIGVTGKL